MAHVRINQTLGTKTCVTFDFLYVRRITILNSYLPMTLMPPNDVSFPSYDDFLVV